MVVCLAEVEAEESSSLKQLQALISIACEYLGLWKILCDHQFHVIAGSLNPVSILLSILLLIVCSLFSIVRHPDLVLLPVVL